MAGARFDGKPLKGIFGSLSKPWKFQIDIIGNRVLTAVDLENTNIAICTGTGSYAITLPLANTVEDGTGLTIIVAANSDVGIAVTGSDTLDQVSVALKENDRVFCMSNGVDKWWILSRSNGVDPRFPQGAGFWNKTPPTVQPSANTTEEIVTVLKSYGLIS